MAAMSKSQGSKRVGVLLVAGSVAVLVGGKLWSIKMKALQDEQDDLRSQGLLTPLKRKPPCSPVEAKSKVAVNALFAKRLCEILRLCVPHVWSKESFLIFVQTCFLYSRTLLTDRIASLEGKSAQAIISKNWSNFFKYLIAFALTSLPAAVVNSGLKAMRTIISLSLQKVLTEHLHQAYLTNHVYYVASNLRGLSNPDQRITEDVAKFCSSISELYSYTFKPVLDVILFSRSLAKTIGYKGQFVLYGYFLLSSSILRAISPPLALLTAQEAALSGNFRNAHQRIVAHAEEIAFNDPPGGVTECKILNDHLHRLIWHSQLFAVQRFLQQVADGYAVKYLASIIGLCVFAAPFYFVKESDSKLSTEQYVRSIRLLMNTSNAIGQLVLIYKRVTTLAGHTSRVSELLESVKMLSATGGKLKANITSKPIENDPFFQASNDILPRLPYIVWDEIIKFDNVTVYAPDGTLLVRELSFEVLPRNSVIIMGPNGSGKSSLLRVLAELWPLHSGTISKPPMGKIFYLSQRPYVVRGTLRDQVCYPDLQQDSLKLATRVQTNFASPSTPMQQYYIDDNRVMEALEATEIGYLLDRGDGLDQIQNWEETLSGGERQRLAISRLLYHCPKFAVLDECTSAVSMDGEEKLYKRIHESGITMLSIAHRPAVKKFHSVGLYLDGSQHGFGWRLEKLDLES
ncbi:hypothetical protein SUGI_0194450 [Cryptomeria japonica]|uniref:uncharacterized protein LOC131034070 n=1 Tax=Cryptomeria japonica TaxID=3369 RepID=UPI0024089447|nr:uncharacterized protein LOC131034070 [Cryptomeria japonica]GLJ12604.1 hypothetical protein SUGI_0194450 [Cryptomeria japonica]